MLPCFCDVTKWIFGSWVVNYAILMRFLNKILAQITNFSLASVLAPPNDPLLHEHLGRYCSPILTTIFEDCSDWHPWNGKCSIKNTKNFLELGDPFIYFFPTAGIKICKLFELLLTGFIRLHGFPLNIWKVSKLSGVFSLRDTISFNNAFRAVFTKGTPIFWMEGYFEMLASIVVTLANYQLVASILFDYHACFDEPRLWNPFVDQQPHLVQISTRFQNLFREMDVDDAFHVIKRI